MNNPFLVCSDRELRALPTQWMRAERWEKVGSLLYDLEFMEAQVGQLSIDELLQNYASALYQMPVNDDWFNRLFVTKKILDRQAHTLRSWDVEKQPAFFLQQIHGESLEHALGDLQARSESALANKKIAPYLLRKYKVGFESPELVRTFIGHSERVKNVAMSSDGRLAVSASGDMTLRVWDVATGYELRTLIGHSGDVNGVALSSDGRLAVSASGDKTLRVWDVETGRELHRLIGHSEGVNRVAMSSDGRLAVSGSEDKTVRVWDLLKGCELRTLTGHSDGVDGVALSADGKIAISVPGYLDDMFKVWNVTTGREMHALKGSRTAINGIALSADGKLALYVSVVHVDVWNVVTGRKLHTLCKNTTQEITGIALSVNKRLAAFGIKDDDGKDNTLRVIDVTTGRDLCTLFGHSKCVRSVAFSADGRLVISASDDCTLKVWDISALLQPPLNLATSMHVRETSNLSSVNEYKYGVTSVALSANGQMAVSASIPSGKGTLKVWDVATGHELRRFEAKWYDDLVSDLVSAPFVDGRVFSTHSIALSADGRLAVSALAGTLKVWDIETGQKLRTIRGHHHDVTGVALRADGLLAVSVSRDKTLKVWDVATGHELQTLQGHTKWIHSVALSADGRLAVSASWDKTLKVWDVATGRELYTLTGHRMGVNSVALSADGRFAVSASDDETLKVWDMATGCEIRTLQGHKADVTGVALNTDGWFTVSVSRDKTLIVWYTATGQIASMLPFSQPLNCCAITPDGETIIAGDDIGKLHFLEFVDPIYRVIFAKLRKKG